MQWEYVLYVNYRAKDPSKLCRGSTECMKYLSSGVNVQNVSELMQQGHALPSWLNGTPILVDVSSKRAYRGKSAIRYIRQVHQSNIPVNTLPVVDPENQQDVGMRGHVDENLESGPSDDNPFASLVTKADEVAMHKQQRDGKEQKVTEDEVTRHIQEREDMMKRTGQGAKPRDVR